MVQVAHCANEAVRTELLERIKQHCGDLGGCWVWRGAMSGLQPIMHDPLTKSCRPVRKLVWEAVHGQAAPSGLGCKFGSVGCVCPRHLEQKKHADQIKLGLSRSPQGRALKRQKLQQAKRQFTHDQLKHIQECLMTQSAYAELYECHRTTISRIQNMRTNQPVSSPFAGLF